MLTVVVHYGDSPTPAMTMTGSDLFGDSDLPALAARLALMLPAAERVQIFDDASLVADTDTDPPETRPPATGNALVLPRGAGTTR
ncbi:hypothetical protein ACG83_26010 [Frankia sp. R43]|nr:hypothetical protein ACG83_26010 [Frankia sp. R43]